MQDSMASRQRKPRDVQTRFNKAVSVVQSLPKDGPFQPSNMMKLKFYALYKQATTGPCNISKPGFWDVTGRAKWEAWNMAGNMPKEEAMLNYVEELQKIVETMPQSKEVEDFLQSIGPFYEEVEKPTQPTDADTTNSELTGPPEQSTVASAITVETLAEENKEDSDEEIFSDPLATPESLSPLLSPHHPLKSPFINSSSEGELSDEYVVVGNQAKASAQHSVTNIPPTVTSASGNADQHDGDTTVATADAQSPILTSTQLEQVQRDLQSILQRLNSLETLLKRRRDGQATWWLRPFSNLSWLSLVLLILLWPVLVNIFWRKLRNFTNRLFITRH